MPSKEEPIALIAATSAQLAERERRLGLKSSNSPKPPSRDKLKKSARVRSLGKRSSMKPGGQKVRKGETPRQAVEPGQAADHCPSACRDPSNY